MVEAEKITIQLITLLNASLCVHIKGCSQPLMLSKEKSSELREWLDRKSVLQPEQKNVSLLILPLF